MPLLGTPNAPDPNCGRCGGSGYIEYPDQPGGGIGGGPRVEACPCAAPSAGGGTSSASSEGCLSWLFGNIILGIFGLGLLVLIVIGVGIYQSVTSNRPGILGEDASESTWSGAYVCDGGEMALDVDLTVAPGGPADHRELEAQITYLPSEDAPPEEVLHESTARGTLADRTVNMIGEEPTGAPPFQISAITATVSEEADLLLGTVVAESCASFGLVPE